MSSSDCGYAGNSDIYGLGIRVGLYLQWFSFTIANFFKLKSRDSAHTAYLAFQVALTVACYVITFGGNIDGSQPHHVEVVILLYLYYGGIFIMTSSNLEDESSWTWQLQVLVRVFIGVYAVWFWAIVEQNTYYFSYSITCTTFVFFFVNISGTSLRAIGILLAIFAGVDTVSQLYLLYGGSQVLIDLIKEIFWPLSKEYRQEMCQFLNEDCSELLHIYGRATPGLPETFWKQVRVEDITYSKVLLRNDYQPVRRALRHSASLSGKPELDKARLQKGLNLQSRWQISFPEGNAEGDTAELFGLGCKIGLAQKMSIGEEECRTISEFLRKAFTIELRFASLMPSIRASVEASIQAGDFTLEEDNLPSLVEQVFRTPVWAIFSRSLIRVVNLISLLSRLAICTWVILAVELMLEWNGILAIHTAGTVGQLIPLVIGLVVFVNTLSEIRTKFQVREIPIVTPIVV